MKPAAQDSNAPLRVLFAGHEATRTGAPIGFLSLIEWLKRHGHVEPVMWLRRGGDLEAEHAGLGRLAVAGDAGALAEAGAVHLAYLNTATLGDAAERLAEAGIPVICHAHEMDFELAATGPANLERLRRCARLFVACSQAVKESLMRCAGVEEGRIVVVHECVDVERALRQAADGGGEDKAAGTRLVCGMGTVSWRKGVDLFLRVVAELGGEWRGLWIGDLESGPDAARVRHDLRVLRLEDRVRFTGSVANPHALLSRADVFCLTSREDPFPLAMVEAAALGLPVIGFQGSGGVEEFAAHGAARTAAYADTHGMARLVEEAAGAAADGRGAAAARSLCHPDVVGRALLEHVQKHAAPEAVKLSAALCRGLAACGAGTVRVAATARFGSAGAPVSGQWEGAAEGGGRVVFDVAPETAGPFEIELAPQGRSVVMQQVKVTAGEGGAAETKRAAQVRTAGRAVRICREQGGTWLLLDGNGRLVLRGEACPGDGTLAVSWQADTDVKKYLAARGDKTAEPARDKGGRRASLWRRLGLGGRGA